MAKPAGITTHPEFRNDPQGASSLLKSLRDQLGLYLYPVHRLDRPVSGVCVFAKSKEIARELSQSWHHESTSKFYLAVCSGTPPHEGSFDFALMSKDKKKKQEAHTLYKRLWSGEDLSLCLVSINQGRYHQIRRHFSRSFFYLIGDAAHGKGSINRRYRESDQLFRPFLHSYQLSFTHPRSLKKCTFRARPSSDLIKFLKKRHLPFELLDSLEFAHYRPPFLGQLKA